MEFYERAGARFQICTDPPGLIKMTFEGQHFKRQVRTSLLNEFKTASKVWISDDESRAFVETHSAIVAFPRDICEELKFDAADGKFILKHEGDKIKVTLLFDGIYYECMVPEKYKSDFSNVIKISTLNREIAHVDTPYCTFKISRLNTIEINEQATIITKLSAQLAELSLKISDLEKTQHVHKTHCSEQMYIFDRIITIKRFQVTGTWQRVEFNNNDLAIMSPANSCILGINVTKIAYSTDFKEWKTIDVSSRVVQSEIRARYLTMSSDDKILNCFDEVTFYSY